MDWKLTRKYKMLLFEAFENRPEVVSDVGERWRSHDRPARSHDPPPPFAAPLKLPICSFPFFYYFSIWELWDGHFLYRETEENSIAIERIRD